MNVLEECEKSFSAADRAGGNDAGEGSADHPMDNTRF
jgi:hypothetical protein